MTKRKATEQNEQLPVKKPIKVPVESSISICIPSNAISSKNAYNLEQKTMIAYQIAKACLIYNVSEIVVLQSSSSQLNEEDKSETINIGNKVVFKEEEKEREEEVKDRKDLEMKQDGLLLASLLQFFITPTYLVKTVFSPHLNANFKEIIHKFKYAYKLPKITTLPFMQNNQVYRDFKEGIVIPRETPKIKSKKSANSKFKTKAPHKVTVSKYVNIGEKEPLKLDIAREVPIYSRVTIDLKNKMIISPEKAYGIAGYRASFGYHVRLVEKDQFNKIFTQSPIEDGYSETIFINCDDYFDKSSRVLKEMKLYNDREVARGKHILMILGNYRDIQVSYEADKEKSEVFEGLDNGMELFDYRMDIPLGCRIEDGVLITLTKLRSEPKVGGAAK
ncbi:hypothetical protein KGF56_004065 [Candida oxycetoniae]|uniref:DUF171-domain-containing protein n=1 Tax=Candida oxycetoniae TaxID=497107 RepID=A0AAI9SUK4_9ASCO|nr:uncharacterized protein KGF56_004065 [Candida oxycetoniae]KAI3403176.2 hypothetical protein KGF56_004065 [Candida oxycetoniae]